MIAPINPETIKHSLREALDGEEVVVDLDRASGWAELEPKEIERLVELLAPVVRAEVVAELDFLIDKIDNPKVLERLHSAGAAIGAVLQLLDTARGKVAPSPAE